MDKTPRRPKQSRRTRSAAILSAMFVLGLARVAFAQQSSEPTVQSLPPLELNGGFVTPVYASHRTVEIPDTGVPLPPDAERVMRRRRLPLVGGGFGFLGAWIFAGTS